MEISESSHLSQSQRKEQKCIFAWTQKSIHMISELKENLRALIHPKVQGNKKDTSLNQNDAHDIYISRHKFTDTMTTIQAKPTYKIPQKSFLSCIILSLRHTLITNGLSRSSKIPKQVNPSKHVIKIIRHQPPPHNFIF